MWVHVIIVSHIDSGCSSEADRVCVCVCGVPRDKDKVPCSSMNVGKPNRVCHFGSTGCQHWGAAVVKTMTFLFASMSPAEPKRCPVVLFWPWEGMQTQRGKKNSKSHNCEEGAGLK